jgi:hypothetical protein
LDQFEWRFVKWAAEFFMGVCEEADKKSQQMKKKKFFCSFLTSHGQSAALETV